MRKEYLLYRHLTGGRARLRLHGPDARRFLHGMVSNDVKALSPGQGCHAALLTVKGKLLADLVIYDCGELGLVLEYVASAHAQVYGALDRHLIMDDATLVDLSAELGQLGVYGDGAAEALDAALGFDSVSALVKLPTYHFIHRPLSTQELPTFVARTKELGLPGFHLFSPIAAIDGIAGKLAAAGGSELSPEAAEVLRVEAGVPLYGVDIDEDRMPAEAGLDDAVSFSKGCYLGQEVVVRLRDRGHLNRKLSGLRLQDGGPPAAPGTRLRNADKPNAGVITSSVISPRLGTIALGYVHRSVWEPGTVLELISVSPTGDETPLGRTAQVVGLPFPPPDR
jgi:folate-binding protein YgfZ